jgi:peptidoglycan/xylan/chitin deacetylase (PgdA/CDA1 family)
MSYSDDARVLGDWFAAPIRRRVLRRLLMRLPSPLAAMVAFSGPRARVIGREAARWRAVRECSTPTQWRRGARSSYVVLYYHRLAGELKPGQERLDVPPELFARQMRLLRRLRFRPLTPEQLIAFHEGSLPALPRRSYVITADDGFLDCVTPFVTHARVRPQLFVPTAEVGGRSWWAGDEPLANWADLRRMSELGVAIGSHAHRHVPLPEVGDDELLEELTASRDELRRRLPAAPPILSYPHGRRDARVLESAVAAGFALAFTTDPGRNGANADQMQLRRIGVKAWDSSLSFLWKATTGQLLPPRWEARRISRGVPSYRPHRPTVGPDAG